MTEVRKSFPEQDVILRTGATRRRNYRDLPFCAQMSEEDAALIVQRAGESLLASGQGFTCERLGEMEPLARGRLAENSLLNRRDLEWTERASLCLDALDGVAVVLCGQEHLLIRTLQEGENLLRAVRLGREQEALLGRRGEFAFDPQFGFLTGRLSDAGTGLCPWALLHLPLLGEEKHFPERVRQLAEEGLTLAALDEGAGPVGRRYLLASRCGFGLSEEEQVGAVRQAALDLAEEERELRNRAQSDPPVALCDRLYRSQALLSSARLMGAQEMTGRMYDLRLGVCLGLFEGSLTRIDQTMRALLPCSLKMRSGDMSAQAENAARAALLRRFMKTMN